MSGRKPAMAVQADEYCYGIVYKGAKDALIAAGVLREEWMPRVLPGRKKANGYTKLQDGTLIHVMRRRAPQLAVVHHFRDEEYARRQAKLDAERAVSDAHKAVAELPSSSTDFRHFLGYPVFYIHELMRSRSEKSLGGYRLAPDSAIEIRNSITDLSAMIERARVVFSGADRAREESMLRAPAIAHDADFGQFMATIMTAPSADDGHA